MAGHISNGMAIDYADGWGEAVVNGRLWRWEFHDYLGPTFLRKDGEPRKCQCPTVPAVWDAFAAWEAKHRAAREAKSCQRQITTRTISTTSPADLATLHN